MQSLAEATPIANHYPEINSDSELRIIYIMSNAIRRLRRAFYALPSVEVKVNDYRK